jgi:hypothetical protein
LVLPHGRGSDGRVASGTSLADALVCITGPCLVCIGVEVTGEPLRRGIASLEAHAAYLAALPDHPAPKDIIPKFTAMGGRAMGVEHAVLFRAHDLQAPPEFFTEAMQD